jgi:hypothetical protein
MHLIEASDGTVWKRCEMAIGDDIFVIQSTSVSRFKRPK